LAELEKNKGMSSIKEEEEEEESEFTSKISSRMDKL
jgi:hypothetical protein